MQGQLARTSGAAMDQHTQKAVRPSSSAKALLRGAFRPMAQPRLRLSGSARRPTAEPKEAAAPSRQLLEEMQHSRFTDQQLETPDAGVASLRAELQAAELEARIIESKLLDNERAARSLHEYLYWARNKQAKLKAAVQELQEMVDMVEALANHERTVLFAERVSVHGREFNNDKARNVFYKTQATGSMRLKAYEKTLAEMTQRLTALLEEESHLWQSISLAQGGRPGSWSFPSTPKECQEFVCA